jgi:phenylalanyl-tRNA synthetase alpha chain
MDEIVNEYEQRIRAAADLAALDAVRISALGKSGAITEQLKALGKLAPDERKRRGELVNAAKQRIAELIAERKAALETEALAAQLASERVDVTMPGRRATRGNVHPLTRTLDRITAIFRHLGYSIAEGPEVEDDWHNFEALNFPPHHPARAMHDTFYVEGGMLLRTHTSPVQIRSMTGGKPPIRVVIPGRVYRADSDQTHSPMFHQVEGLVVGEDVDFGDLKGTLLHFIEAFFEVETELMFRPSYFPFTEPSADVLMAWQQPDGSKRWLEVLGCGMVHPNVLRNCGIDPERYTGFAFGLGVERFAMLRYGVRDLRAFFENDVRFLAQFA